MPVEVPLGAHRATEDLVVSIFGRSVLILAMIAAVAAIILALGSRTPGRRHWQQSAERAVYSVCALVTIAIGTMWIALVGDHFQLRNVADYSTRDMPSRFKFTALWGSQAGSLLLWAWLLSVFAAICVYQNRARNRELMPVVVAVLMGLAVFFTGVLTFLTSPFEILSPTPANGTGLNPLLRNPYMIIHPPLLYLGYVGLGVPFAFGMAALVTGRLDTQWIVSIRRWTMFAWICLAIGILLGSRWAYEELGWGGYWEWDPVENAALMPWLTATAFLHSIMVQERRGMLKVWNMSLVTLTFSLSLFGTFLTRSGLLQSVHAFGESTLGPYFLALICVTVAGAVILIIRRLDSLKTENGLESYISREGIFLFNNLLLVALAATVFWGTMFPVLSEAVNGHRIAVGPPYYNQVATPIGIALLIMTGIGPLIPWRKASLSQLRRRFIGPLAISAAGALALLLTPAWGSWPAGLTFTAAIFVFACVGGEFWRGTVTRHRLGSVSWPGALVDMVARNRRRYGGYLVHLGISVLFVGLAGSSAFVSDADATLKPGQSMQVAGYRVVNECIVPPPAINDPCWRRREGDVASIAMQLGVFSGKDRVATLVPQKNFYFSANQPSTEAAIDTGPTRDLYAIIRTIDTNRVASVSVFVNPLVMWLWIAGLMILGGTSVAAWPARRRERAHVAETASDGDSLPA